jgi:HAMP domain-containing protein
VEASDGTLALAWERREGRTAGQIFYAELDREAGLRGEAEEVTRGLTSKNSPHIAFLDGEVYLFWFEDPAGAGRVVLGSRTGRIWRTRELATLPGVSTFPNPVIYEGRIFAFWQNRSGNQTGLAYLEPDRRTNPPQIRPVNFVAGRRAALSEAEITWSPPPDPSGIAGYSYVWTRDPREPVPEELRVFAGNEGVELPADEDGSWYLRVSALDFAGNWSEPATVEFVRDLTPPDPVQFVEPVTDEDGFLASNSFTVRWEPPEAEDTVGYSYRFDRVAGARADDIPVGLEPATPPSSIVTETPQFSRQNEDNGLWALSVAPIDSVGNRGAASRIFLRLNKYVPVTFITFVDTEQDRLGRYDLSIFGRGFAENGRVNELYLDRDGVAPFDYIFTLRDGDYSVRDDREILGPTLELVDTGQYRVGLRHPERGIYFTQPLLALERSGTVKFGDYTIRYAPQISAGVSALFVVDASDLVLYGTAALILLTVFLSSVKLSGLAAEGRMLRYEARVLIEGRTLSIEQRKKRVRTMRRKGLSLGVKFASVIAVLVIVVVVGLGFFVGRFVVETQRETLATGLQQRAEVLLESIVSGAEPLFGNPANNQLEIADLVNQGDALSESLYVTLTGPGRDDPSTYAAVWASSDEEVVGEEDPAKIDTDDFVRGVSVLGDSVSERAVDIRAEINRRAEERLGDRPQQIEELNAQIREVALSANPDQEEINELDEIRIQVARSINQDLNELANEYVETSPAYDPTDLSNTQTEFIFYKPILVLGESSRDVYQGMVRLAVTTVPILEEIRTAQNQLIQTIAIIAVAAVGFGILGAILLARLVVSPINKLVRGVEFIDRAKDKATLTGQEVQVRTRDELSELAESINKMSGSLSQAAKEQKDLIATAELQKMFIPLETEEGGLNPRKLTMAHEDLGVLELHGYYEGADALSGDYFTFERIEEKKLAFIKCDVSGHGVRAAFMMVEVATMFENRSREWKERKSKVDLNQLVEDINLLFETRGFSGMFALMTLGLINIETGTFQVTHAGDRNLRILRGADRAVELVELPTAPATGMVDSELFRAPQERTLGLSGGDAILLPTDGVEESARFLRNPDFSMRYFEEEEGKALVEQAKSAGSPSGATEWDPNSKFVKEEFSNTRIEEIIAAVLNEDSFQLRRFQSLVPNEDLRFDYSGLEPTARNLVIAVMAAEKVFRLTPRPAQADDEPIRIDLVLDDFLRERFNAYSSYFSQPVAEEERPDAEDPRPEYRFYHGLHSETQSDDLTILAIRRKA